MCETLETHLKLSSDSVGPPIHSSGTGSTRCALVSHLGDIKTTHTEEIKTFRSTTDPNIFEQSTTDIWNAIAKCTRSVLQQSGLDDSFVKGIGFDATCSLAVCDLRGNSITVTGGDGLGDVGERNVILWADHRAWKEAKFINSTGSDVLRFVGGTMSVRNPMLTSHPYSIIQLILVLLS